jgi:hypothetical protein
MFIYTLVQKVDPPTEFPCVVVREELFERGGGEVDSRGYVLGGIGLDECFYALEEVLLLVLV